jgi:hypothetical protein
MTGSHVSRNPPDSNISIGPNYWGQVNFTGTMNFRDRQCQDHLEDLCTKAPIT